MGVAFEDDGAVEDVAAERREEEGGWEGLETDRLEGREFVEGCEDRECCGGRVS